MWKRYRRKEILGMRRVDSLVAVEKNTWFYLGTNSISQILYGLKRMSEPILEHVDNNFNPLPAAYVEEYTPIIERTDHLLEGIQQCIDQNDFSQSDQLLVEGNALKSDISAIRHSLLERIQNDESSLKSRSSTSVHCRRPKKSSPMRVTCSAQQSVSAPK